MTLAIRYSFIWWYQFNYLSLQGKMDRPNIYEKSWQFQLFLCNINSLKQGIRRKIKYYNTFQDVLFWKKFLILTVQRLFFFSLFSSFFLPHFLFYHSCLLSCLFYFQFHFKKGMTYYESFSLLVSRILNIMKHSVFYVLGLRRKNKDRKILINGRRNLFVNIGRREECRPTTSSTL